MKNKFPFPCDNCGHGVTVEPGGSQRFPDAKCRVCKVTIYSTDNSTVGARVLFRAQQEVEGGDFTIGIILSAMAVECELTHLFFKWKRIDLHMADPSVDVQISEEQERKWVAEYGNLKGISRKLDNFSRLMTGSDFDSFVSSANLRIGLYGGSPKKFFVEYLFHHRNEVLHAAQVDFGEPEATKCLEQARTLFKIIAAMHGVRYNRVFPPQQHTSSA